MNSFAPHFLLLCVWERDTVWAWGGCKYLNLFFFLPKLRRLTVSRFQKAGIKGRPVTLWGFKGLKGRRADASTLHPPSPHPLVAAPPPAALVWLNKDWASSYVSERRIEPPEAQTQSWGLFAELLVSRAGCQTNCCLKPSAASCQQGKHLEREQWQNFPARLKTWSDNSSQAVFRFCWIMRLMKRFLKYVLLCFSSNFPPWFSPES